MITILGAGGAIANEVVKLLSARKQLFRLVARKARPVSGATEIISADVSDKDQTIRAVAGSSIVYLLVGLKYDHKLWAEMWPRIMANTIEACKRSGAKLIFFDNVYMYGTVSGAMTADFYGPETPNSPPNVLVFEPFAKNQKASWLANDSVPHSFTYTPDAARSIVTLAESESAWNQTWHVATTPNPPTGKEFIAMAAKELGVAPRYRVLSRPMVRLIGWFNPLVGEVYEIRITDIQGQ
jgi:nucleoside-diphosphate-sugar epimerase